MAAQEIPADENILSTHLVFKIKKTEQGERSLKSKMVVHVNREDGRDKVRKDY